MSRQARQRTDDAVARARTIARRIAQREDREARRQIEAYKPRLEYDHRRLGIADIRAPWCRPNDRKI